MKAPIEHDRCIVIRIEINNIFFLKAFLKKAIICVFYFALLEPIADVFRAFFQIFKSDLPDRICA